MKRFISADRELGVLMPYDVNLWLPESHLARFVVDIVDRLDFGHIYKQYKGPGTLLISRNTTYLRLNYLLAGE